jgi:hypothetical protein
VRPNLEVAENFRRHGEAWRAANVGPREPHPATCDGHRRLVARVRSASRVKTTRIIGIAYLEAEDGLYVASDHAAAAQWRATKRLADAAAKDGRSTYDSAVRRGINHMVKLAKEGGIPDDVPLLPRLDQPQGGNVVPLHR